MIGASDLSAGAKRKLANVAASCTECQSLREGDHASVPSLAKVFESDIASSSYQFYSQALLGTKGKWTAERLAAFIGNPQQFAPGTTMPPPSGLDEATLSNLVRLLQDIEAH